MTVTGSNSAADRFPRWRWGLVGAAMTLLAGALLLVLIRPILWPEGRYPRDRETALDRPTPDEGALSVQPSTRDRAPRSAATIRIGQSTAAPSGPTGAGPVPATSSRATAARPAAPAPLRISRGFQPEQTVSLDPAPAAAKERSAPVAPSPGAAQRGRAPAAKPMTPALSALLLPPPLLVKPTAAAPAIAARPAAPTRPAPPESLPLEPNRPPVATSPTPRPPTAPRPPIATVPPASSPATPRPQPEDSTPPLTAVPTPTPEAAPPPAETSPLEVPPAETPAPDITPAPVIPATPPPTLAIIPNQVRVQQFAVNGSTVFDPEDLAAIALRAVQAEDNADGNSTCKADQAPVPLSEPLLLTPSQLLAASDAIEQCYIQANFINSGAYIAQSELTGPDDGTVAITVVEGRLEAININMTRSGLFGLNSSYVESRLRAAIGDLFNLNDLLEAVQLLELDPLIDQISTEIVPGTQTGTSILNANVVQDDGFDLTFSLDNDRSPAVGSFRKGITLSQANLLGLGDRLSLGYSASDGSDGFNFGYSIPINSLNGTIGFNFSNSNSRVIEEPFSILDIVSSSREYEIFYRQPLILTPTEEFALTLKGSHRDSQAAFLEGLAGEAIPFPGTGADANGRTRVTALRFGQEWTTRNPGEVISLLSEFSLGIGALNATTQPIGPDGQFLLWRGQGQWARRLGSDSLFLLRGNLQLADRPLLPSEQFSFGGQSAGRGYRLNTLLRDNGWFLSAEARFPLLRVPEQSMLLQIAPFFDVGGGWNVGEAPDTLFLTSTGLGLILDIGDSLSARLDWGLPLSDFQTSGKDLQDSGIYFSIRFTPF